MSNIQELEPQEISTDILIEKYCKNEENDITSVRQRVSKTLSSIEINKEEYAIKFYEAQENGFIPGGRINSAAGMNSESTLINCFIQPIGDSISEVDSDGYPSIYDAIKQAAETMRRGGGVGYDFSRIRPLDAYVKGTQSKASGPLSYMRVFDKSCETVESAGGRRGAQMGVLRCDHPDIFNFITAKNKKGEFNNFNLSIGVTDKFMKTVEDKGKWDLVHKTKPCGNYIKENNSYYDENSKLWIWKTIQVTDLWDLVMKSTYNFAEPGILFIDRMNEENNLYYCETIEATNPCVTGDAVILTDQGYKRIDSIINTEVTVWNGFEWSITVPRITGENQEIIDFEFSDGSKLPCTPYHNFILEDGTRIEAKDLCVDMKLAKFNFPIIVGNTEIDRKIAYTQGFYSGDGQKDTNRIWLYEEKCNLIPYLSLSAYSDQSTDGNLRFMASLDHFPQPKNFVPNVDFSINTRLDWLAGLIDSDGTVSEDSCIQIWSVDREFLQNVKYLLNTLGTTGTISLGHKARVQSLPDGNGLWKNYNCQESWRLIISASSVVELYNIGLNTHRITINSFPNRDASRFITVTFKHKRNYLEPYVYCFTEEKNHSGIFNGIMTAQCAEQPLPPYGCCDLGSINLTKFVIDPFTPNAWFDYHKFKETVKISIRMLDNVLDVTAWPLEQQKQEAMNKRRIGLGFLGIGDAIIMLGKHYNKACGVEFASEVSRVMRDTAYLASVELAKEKGAFPLFDADKYLNGKFIQRLPDNIKDEIRQHGIRNSHLLSIAPTGTIALAFADNASNGIEPPFSWVYDRKKRMMDGSKKTFEVADHAWRLYRSMGHDMSDLPSNFTTALQIAVNDHIGIMKVVQPYIDTAISKCVAKGTPIITNKGILPIESLGNAYIEDTFDTPLNDLKVLCPDGEWREVTAHYYGGYKKTIAIHLSNGQTIEASETHKLMTTEDWEVMPNLSVGDYIKVRRNTKLNYIGGLPINDIEFSKNSNDYFIPSNMTPQLALFLGIMASDGHLFEEKGMVSVTNNNSIVVEYFSKLANTLFGVSDVKHIIDPRNSVDSWYFNSRSICRWITGLIGYCAEDKRIPVEIMSGSKEEMQMFLSGLSLNGYKSDQNSTCIYFGKSKQLATQSFSLLKALGYNPRLTKKKVEGYDYLAYGVSAKGINFCLEERKNTEDSYDNEFIKIPNEIFNKKLNTSDIGYNTRKGWIARDNVICREQQFLTNFKDIPDRDFIYYRIEKIETCINEIYDIEVKDSHDYLIDGVVSHNTVNIPFDYPYEDFKNLYIYAWKSGLKGISTYRPNDILGSVLSVKEEPKTTVAPIIDEITIDSDNGKTLDDIVMEMYSQPFESREDGALPGVSVKGRFHTNQGEQKFIITINFLILVRHTKFGKITIRRPVEFILTSNFTTSSSAWDAAMRFMSLMGRSGVSMVKVIENLREITWEHGNVRYGTKIKDDKKIALWHSSDAAAIGYIIEEALINDGYLTEDGKLAKKYTLENETTITKTKDTIISTLEVDVKIEEKLLLPSGKRCPECGAYNLEKREGCEVCSNCNYKGECG